ncbi:MAG: efflux RND transporter periplasmic adaptor subunit [Bdellovibrionales bacterium]|nr:efflux RND transporter periplasmic adaptor subunit [Bdellovibrionales bacterium]
MIRQSKVHRKRILYISILLVVGGTALLFSSFLRKPSSSVHTEKQLYQCSMHPSVTSDKPGLCPICRMQLQRVDHENHPPEKAPSVSNKKILFYRHPMRPEITSPSPGKDEMGMDFIPVYEEDATETRSSSLPGRASFSLSLPRQQLIGVATTKAIRKPLTLEIRASGRAAFDPELFTAVEEYRQAVISRSQIKESGFPELQQQASALVLASHTKLKLLGLQDRQIKQLSSKNASSLNLLLPTGSAWIYAEVFEYELGALKPGATLLAEAPAIPGKLFQGKISSISPVVTSPTRTIRIRALVPDPEKLLRPDTFLNVKILVELGIKLVVPIDAVLHSGREDYVFVMREGRRFEPHIVVSGQKTDMDQEILSGIKEGDEVVSSANFLIDSESKLRGVLEDMKEKK